MLSSAAVPGRRLILALGLVAACGPGDLRFPPPPDLVPGGAVVWAVREAGRLTLQGGAADDRPLLSLDLPADGFTLEVLVFGESLEALGLARGTITPVAEGTCGARTLPPPFATFRIDGPDEAAWRASETPEDVLAIPYAGPCPCWDFEVVEETELDAAVRAMVSPAAGHVLIFTDERGVWRYDGTRVVQLPAVDPGPEEPWDVLVEGPERLWVADTSGLWVGYPGVGYTQTASISDPDDSLRAVAGGPGPDGFEVYGITDKGVFSRLAPGAPEEVTRRADIPASTNQSAALVWRGPGRVVAAEPSTLSLHVLNGAARTTLTIPAETRGMADLILSGGQAAGPTVLGRVYEIGAEAVDLGAPELATPTDAVAAEAGFLYVGDGGYIQQYHTAVGFCPTRYLLDRPRFLRVAWMGAELVLAALPSAPGRPGSLLRVRVHRGPSG